MLLRLLDKVHATWSITLVHSVHRAMPLQSPILEKVMATQVSKDLQSPSTDQGKGVLAPDISLEMGAKKEVCWMGSSTAVAAWRKTEQNKAGGTRGNSFVLTLMAQLKG